MIQDKLGTSEPKTFYWHYAWMIVVIIAGMQIVGSSIRMAFGVFIDPLQTQFGWSQGGIGFAYAIVHPRAMMVHFHDTPIIWKKKGQ